MTESFNRRTPVLDARLSGAMALAGKCRVFADIGADHGRLSAVMLLSGQAEHGLIADISDKALEKARRRIHGLHLEEKVTFAVADGLCALDRLDTPVDHAFILGMGGDTISGILHRGTEWLRGASLILGPQTEIPMVRQALLDIGYRIRDERIVHDNHRDYLLIKAGPAHQDESGYSQAELWLGPILLKTLPQEWLPVLQRRRRLLAQAVEAMQKAHLEKDRQRLMDASAELECVEKALEQLKAKEDSL